MCIWHPHLALAAERQQQRSLHSLLSLSFSFHLCWLSRTDSYFFSFYFLFFKATVFCVYYNIYFFPVNWLMGTCRVTWGLARLPPSDLYRGAQLGSGVAESESTRLDDYSNHANKSFNRNFSSSTWWQREYSLTWVSKMTRYKDSMLAGISLLEVPKLKGSRMTDLWKIYLMGAKWDVIKARQNNEGLVINNILGPYAQEENSYNIRDDNFFSSLFLFFIFIFISNSKSILNKRTEEKINHSITIHRL